MRDVMWLSAVLICTGAGAGCSKDKAKETPHTTAQAAVPTPEKAAEPAQAKALAPVVEDTTFKLALLGEPHYQAGSDAKVSLVLEPRGAYHVNQDYPLHVVLKAPADVKLTKSELNKADASAFGEKEARFEVGFAAAKGNHELVADVDFAVCTDETCVPDERTVAVVLHVE